MGADAGPARRIVSLLPSATEIVYALGLGDRVVGVSHGCDHPADVLQQPRLSRPRFAPEGLSGHEIDAAVRRVLREHGSVYEIDVERVAALEPDLVLTQGICDVCAVPERQVVAALAECPSRPSLLTLDAHDVPAILAGIRDVGRASGAGGPAEACVGQIQRRVAAVQGRVAGRPKPRVLALEWLDPPYVPGHWVPQLVAFAGGDLVAGVAGRPSYCVGWEELRSADPDVLLLMPCGYTLAQTRHEAEGYRAILGDVAARAMAGGRAYVLEASAYFSRSGPRVADGLEVLAALTHPDLFPDVALTGRAARWP